MFYISGFHRITVEAFVLVGYYVLSLKMWPTGFPETSVTATNLRRVTSQNSEGRNAFSR
jgi:hypothetical protein